MVQLNIQRVKTLMGILRRDFYGLGLLISHGTLSDCILDHLKQSVTIK
jgi:hypothetical protein